MGGFNNMNLRDKLVNILDNKDNLNIVFVTGAGVSVPSGIPDFNTLKGPVVNNIEYSAREALSRKFVIHHESIYLNWINEFKSIEAEPSYIHNLLAEMIDRYSYKKFTLITQNIDNLHQKAFENYFIEDKCEVIDVHGNLDEIKCIDCGMLYEDIDQFSCLICNSQYSEPNIILYGDDLNESKLKLSFEKLAFADIILVFGSSLVVQPIANMVLDHWQNVIVFDKEKPEILDKYPAVEFFKCDFKEE